MRATTTTPMWSRRWSRRVAGPAHATHRAGRAGRFAQARLVAEHHPLLGGRGVIEADEVPKTVHGEVHQLVGERTSAGARLPPRGGHRDDDVAEQQRGLLKDNTSVA